MKSKKYLLLSLIAVTKLIYGEEYTWETPTQNDWEQVIIKGDMEFEDGTILGMNGELKNGAANWHTEPSVLSARKGVESTVRTDGTLNLIVRPKPGEIYHQWYYGIFGYSSTSMKTEKQTTKLTVDSKVNIDFESAIKQAPANEPLGSGIEISAIGVENGTPGERAVTKLDFLNDVSIKMKNKTEVIKTSSGDAPPKPKPSYVEKMLYGIYAKSRGGGRNEINFEKNLDINGSSEIEDRNFMGIYFLDVDPNGKGSELNLKGNTSIKGSLKGGDLRGLYARTVGATQSFNANNLKIDLKNGGKNNTYGAYFFAEEGDQRQRGKQTNTIDGDVKIAVKNEEGIAYGLLLSSQGQSTQNTEFKGMVEVDARTKGTQANGIWLKSSGVGSNQITNFEEIKVDSISEKPTGIYVATEDKGKTNLTVGGKTEIVSEGTKGTQGLSIGSKNATTNVVFKEEVDIEHLSETSSYGMVIRGTNRGKIDVAFENGLTLNKEIAPDKTKDSFGIYAYTDANSTNNIKIEGDTIVKDGVAIYVQGRGNDISINEKKTGNVQILGAIGNYEGTMKLNLNGNDSYLVGDVISALNGKTTIDLDNGAQMTAFTANEEQNKKGIIDISIDNNSLWNVENKINQGGLVSATLNSLNMSSGGKINLGYQEGKQIVFGEKLSGKEGIFRIDAMSSDIDQTGEETDFFAFSKADEGTKHYVELTDISISDLKDYDFGDRDPDRAIWIGDTDIKAQFEGKENDSFSNVYSYTPILDINVRDSEPQNYGGNLYIVDLEKKGGGGSNSIITDTSLHYMNAMLSRIETDTLHKRLGDIRNYKQDNGVWVRTTSGEMEYDKSGKITDRYNMVQAGYDRSYDTENGRVFTGFGIHHRDGNTDFRDGGGKNESLGLSLYTSWVGNDGKYLDVVGKYSHLENEYRVYNQSGMMKADYNTWLGSLSTEFGKKIYSENKKYFMEPQAQLTYTFIDGKNYTTSSGLYAKQDDINSLIGRVGTTLGYDFGKSSHFIKAGLLHEFLGDYGVLITGADGSLRKKLDGSDTWVELGIGGDFKVGNKEDLNIYYDLEKTFGSDFETKWQVSLGARYKF